MIRKYNDKKKKTPQNPHLFRTDTSFKNILNAWSFAIDMASTEAEPVDRDDNCII